MFRFLHKSLANQPGTTYTEKEDVIRMKTQTKAPSCFSHAWGNIGCYYFKTQSVVLARNWSLSVYEFRSWTCGNLKLHSFIVDMLLGFWEIIMGSRTCRCWAGSSLKDCSYENLSEFRNTEIYFADKIIPLLNKYYA